MLTYTITPHDHCRRLESFLRGLLPESTFAYPRKLIKNGAVKLNGAMAVPDTFLFSGDQVTVKESTALTAQLAQTAPELDILYEDDHIVIVNKAAGLAMHRTAEREANLVEAGMGFMHRRGTTCKLYPVNRLDRGTSGAVILAKSAASAGLFGRQVKESGLAKRYLALVRGLPSQCGLIDEPLDGKESVTRFQRLAEGEGCALLDLTPLSGRMHQIRRHLQMIGHPVMGDRRYGGGELKESGCFALHSFRTGLNTPHRGYLLVCAPLSDELLTLCARCAIDPVTLLPALHRIAEERLEEKPNS